MAELKPCPFCESEPFLDVIPPHTHYFTSAFGVDIPDHPGSAFIECRCSACISGDNEKDVIEKWNRRVTDDKR